MGDLRRGGDCRIIGVGGLDAKNCGVQVRVRALRWLVIAAAASFAVAHAADWLNAGGDASRSGWQKRERYFKLENIGNLKLLWKLQVSSAQDALVGPVMMGPIITHRGIKELVFVASASNTV